LSSPAKGNPKNVALDVIRYRDPILDSINEGVFTVDLDWRITSFNRAAENITGIRREDAVGHRCNEVFRANICQNACSMKKVIKTGVPAVNATVFIINSDGARIPIKISAAVLHDTNGQVIGGVETFQDLRQVEELRKKLKSKHTVMDIIGKSEAMSRLFDLLPRIADSDSSVLLQGASGTGKELFARAIHHLSARRKKDFVAVNCGALPDTLLESELFGYKAGAFTDARKEKPGRFALAEGGTLFLDEIGDISPAMQVRLLRVLQEKVYEPLGAVRSVRADVRIITATNKNLNQLVKEGFFRQDLYYRIHVIHLDVPSLIHRLDDIPYLVEHFVATFNRLHDRQVTGLSKEAFSIIMRHDFPGNVRELQNIIEHAFVLCHSGMIQTHHLPSYLKQNATQDDMTHGPGINLRTVEKQLIQKALRNHQGNRTLAARELGINPSTLYRKIHRLGIETPAQDGRSRTS
jgi:PAS domain S-box-containing protein